METTERAKFTPGPWRVASTGEFIDAPTEDGIVMIAGTYGKNLIPRHYEHATEELYHAKLELFRKQDKEMKKANARLIAASPTLYQNAVDAVKLINEAGERLKPFKDANGARSALIEAMSVLNEGIRAADGR